MEVPQQLLSVTVSKVIPFNSWQGIQRGAEWREGRGMAYGKWTIAQTKTNRFWFHLDPTLLSGWGVRSDNCCSGGSPDGRQRAEKKEVLGVVRLCTVVIIPVLDSKYRSVCVCVSLRLRLCLCVPLQALQVEGQV